MLTQYFLFVGIITTIRTLKFNNVISAVVTLLSKKVTLSCQGITE